MIVGAEKNPAAGRDAPRNPVAIDKVTIIEGTDGLTADEKAALDKSAAAVRKTADEAEELLKKI